MKFRHMYLDEMQPAPYNPRIDLKPGMTEYEKLKRSIEEFGQVEPIVFNERTGYIVGGHQRLKVMEDLGYTEVYVTIVDLAADDEMALNVALNKIAGDWDLPKLRDLMLDLTEEYHEPTITGFDQDEIDDLIKDYLEPPKEEPKEVSPPEQLTRPGETWQLGFHRITVGQAWEETDHLIREWEDLTGLTANKL